MAFASRSLLKSIGPLMVARQASTAAVVEKSVFISQSHDVYTNMALEEWISNNYDLKKHHVMLYCRNDPCVLLGNVENPWLSTNVSVHDEENKPALARRQGTGKTVYQDLGSANVTFFGSNDRFDKNYNLSVVKRGIFRKFGLKLTQNDDDLSFYNMKILESGTTTQNNNTFQNCSLFVEVNKNNAIDAIHKAKLPGKQKLLNISEIDSRITPDGVLSAIGWEFMRTPAFELKDGGNVLANKQRGFQMVNPTDKWFPGITEIRDKLSNWDWCYGKTPTFTILRSFPVPNHFRNAVGEGVDELRVKIDINGGRIEDISLFVPPGLSSSGFAGEAKVITELRGQRFTHDSLKSIDSILGVHHNDNEQNKFVKECVKRAMSSA